MRTTLGIARILVATALASAGVATAATHYHVVRDLQLPGEANFDDVRVDATGRVFIARGTFVEVVNRDGSHAIGQLADTPGVHSIAIDDANQRGYVTAGRASSVVVFDLTTFLRITAIATTGDNPDAIVFDEPTHRVVAFNGRGRNATVIDTATNTVVGTIALDAKPEFAVSDGNGRIYVNLEDIGSVAVIDPQTMTVLQRWPIAGCQEPTGLALDRAHARLFSTCGNKIMAVLDAGTGRVVARLPIGAFVDGAAFDPDKQLAFASAGDGRLTIVHEDAPDRFRVVQTVATQRGARTMALDERSHRVYVAAALYVDAPPGADGHPASPRFVAVPGTFRLFVIEP
jgi:DNA-binding beta-propeller fold protein YncE